MGRNDDLNLVGNPHEEIGPQNPEGGEVQEELDNPKAKGHKENPQPLTAPKKDRGVPHLLEIPVYNKKKTPPVSSRTRSKNK